MKIITVGHAWLAGICSCFFTLLFFHIPFFLDECCIWVSVRIGVSCLWELNKLLEPVRMEGNERPGFMAWKFLELHFLCSRILLLSDWFLFFPLQSGNLSYSLIVPFLHRHMTPWVSDTLGGCGVICWCWEPANRNLIIKLVEHDIYVHTTYSMKCLSSGADKTPFMTNLFM